jgi:hypothetical protein
MDTLSAGPSTIGAAVLARDRMQHDIVAGQTYPVSDDASIVFQLTVRKPSPAFCPIQLPCNHIVPFVKLTERIHAQ